MVMLTHSRVCFVRLLLVVVVVVVVVRCTAHDEILFQIKVRNNIEDGDDDDDE